MASTNSTDHDSNLSIQEKNTALKDEPTVISSLAASASQPALPRGLGNYQFFTILGGLCLGLFLALMDMSIISTALYTISVSFEDYRHTIWAATSYILVDVACAVLFTRLSDVYGRKNLILASFTLFTLSSLAAGFSRNVMQLILFRIFQGLGGTGLYSLTMVICPEIAPAEYLPLVVASLGVTVGVAGVCGPVLGGVIASRTTWRWIFWINVPIGAIAIVILALVWPSSRGKVVSLRPKPKLRQIDFLGAILNAVSCLLFVVVLGQVGTKQWSWNSAATIALLIISGLATVAFYSWEWSIRNGDIRTKTLPQLPFRIILHRPMATALMSTLFIGFIQFTAVFSIPLRAQLVDGDSPIKAGLHLLPLVGATACGSILASMASRGQNYTFYTMSIGTALALIGTGLLSSLPADGHRLDALYGYEVILGFGTGMTISTATFMTNLEVQFLDHSVAQGTIAQSRILGGALGIATSTLIMNKHISSSISNLNSPANLQEIFVSPFTIGNYSQAIQLEIRKSYIGAFKEDMRISMCICAVALVVSLAAWQRKPPTVAMRKEQLATAIRAYMIAKAAAAANPMMKNGADAV